jgi:4-amino-4-deoxy-L-arabinose transferase-like glycosyltransferase
MHKRYLSILALLLLIKAIILVFVILYSGIGLGPDEAQYWTWSQALDWGYYSKPPGIAWEIALGTSLFGNTELGVRFMPLVIGFLLPFAVYWMAEQCRLKPQICFWAAVCMAFSPLGILASFLAITDGGMVLFWALTCAYLAGKIEKRETPDYFLVGALIFCGALFKWPMYSFWVVILVSWIFFSFLKSWRILGGIVVSLAALFPSIYWNATHEWATFRHVLATLAGGHAKPKEGAILAGNLLEFFGAQAVLVSPILFILLLLAWHHMIKNKNRLPPSILFCGGLSFVSVAIGTLLAFFMKMQGNWAIFAYPSAFVLLSWFVFEGATWKRKWMVAGVLFSIVVCAAVFSIPAKIPYKISPFRHNVGGEALTQALKEVGYDPEKDALLSDKYQTTSLLSFYGPGQKRAHFLNLQGSRKNQFSFWPGLEAKSQKVFFAVIENIPQLDDQTLPQRYVTELSPYFDTVKFIGMKPLFQVDGRTVKGVFLFEGEEYNGSLPQESELY